MIDCGKTVEEKHRELENRSGLRAVMLHYAGREHVVYLPEDGSLDDDDKRYLMQRVSSLRWIFGRGEVEVDGHVLAQKLVEYERTAGESYAFEERLFRGVAEKLEHSSMDDGVDDLQGSGSCAVFFDAGGSSLKGTLFSNEQLERQLSRSWQPFLMTEICQFERELAEFLVELLDRRSADSVGHVGVSFAGLCREGAVLVSSLMQGMRFSEGQYDPWFMKKLCRSMFPNASFQLMNDAGVTALPHRQTESIKERGVVSLVMGSNLGGGYHPDDEMRGIHELGFVPALWNGGSVDDWSGYRGIGSELFSKKGLLWLAQMVGYKMPDAAHERSTIDQLHTDLRHGLSPARQVFQTMGSLLASFVLYLQRFYRMEEVLLSGGILTSGVVDEMRGAYEKQYAILAGESEGRPFLRMLVVPRVLPEYNQVWCLALHHFSKTDS